jgi:hypothetical protein
MIWNKLKKSLEDKLVPAEHRKKFRAERRKFEGRDVLADQVTSAPGVSDRGIEARRADGRVPANKVVAHGYARVHSDIPRQKEVARKYFKDVAEAQRKQTKPNLPKSELAKAPIAYHGSPNDFTEFDTKQAGSQHGTARGHGVYVSGKKEGATFYANARKDPTKGGLYRVDRPKDEFFLHWDLPISKQPRYVRDRIVNSPIYHSANERAKTGQFLSGDQLKGGEAYGGLQHYHDMTPEQASAHLHSLGIKGIKYKHDDYHNYVVFHPKDAKIMSVQQTPKQKPKKLAASEPLKKEQWGREGMSQNPIHGWISPTGEYHHMGEDDIHTDKILDLTGKRKPFSAFNPESNANAALEFDRHRQKVNEDAYKEGWIKIGSAGDTNVAANSQVLTNKSHPATRKLRELIANAARDPKNRAGFWHTHMEIHHQDGAPVAGGEQLPNSPEFGYIDAQHFARHGAYKPHMGKSEKMSKGWSSKLAAQHRAKRPLTPQEAKESKERSKRAMDAAVAAVENAQKPKPGVKLEHYSPQKGLKQISPEFQGQGVDQGRAQNRFAEGHPLSFFYLAGTEPEHIVRSPARSKYIVQLPKESKIYDIGTDPDGILAKLREEAKNRQINPGVVTREDQHAAIKAAGYHGYTHSGSALPNVVALYHSAPVSSEEDV